MSAAFRIVVVGLTLSSSWGNGHATTFRSLLKGVRALGARVLFLEHDKPWYAAHRDLPEPDFCDFALYEGVDDLVTRFRAELTGADAVIVGSYVPEGVEVIDRLLALAPGRVSFYDIDTPVTLAKLERGDEEYLAARQIPHFATYFSFTGGPTLQRLEKRLGAPRAQALYCSVEAERYRNTGASKRWDLGYLGTYSPDRQPVLDKLLIEPARHRPDKRFVVAGPQYPAEIDWPANVERIEHCPPADHAEFYSRQGFTLNVTRADMVAAGWSPSVRLFEAAAAGVPIISDRWDGLGELLPEGEAILLAERTEDVLCILDEVDASRRAALAEKARAIVLEDHTGSARARELLNGLREQIASSSAVERRMGAS